MSERTALYFLSSAMTLGGFYLIWPMETRYFIGILIIIWGNNIYFDTKMKDKKWNIKNLLNTLFDGKKSDA